MKNENPQLAALVEGKQAHIYYHANCFDGAASAGLLLHFLSTQTECSGHELHPVSYVANGTWGKTELRQPALVVDFLYHPDAAAWWDHHPTAFSQEHHEASYSGRPRSLFRWEQEMRSCALLIREHFASYFGYSFPDHESLVAWATKIDSAQYASPEEAIDSAEPALQINRSLSGAPSELNNLIVERMALGELSKIAQLASVQDRFRSRQREVLHGLDVVKDALELLDDVAVYDVEAGDTIVDRFAPYYYYPHALFSVGRVVGPRNVRILTMRNPWSDDDLDYPNLGEFCERFGGGGHKRVGAIVFDLASIDASNVAFEAIVTRLRQVRAKQVQSL